ncbi:hypothetical protein [Curtobacterium herbarum]|uniref:Uncharacterized protein n=1 Tax=Curtobacterium herbarum TaxID=150122 RepID=A0ABP4K1F1_9MICO|nr:hypothetical protein [Curtobacterium herbarum]MBM7475385.1 hypothetical protein [Curtobacterium herbarum]MCS6543301.1 hypothetical protein [Curtobacterium herbarum]
MTRPHAQPGAVLLAGTALSLTLSIAVAIAVWLAGVALLPPQTMRQGAATAPRSGPVVVTSPTQRDLDGWTATPTPTATPTSGAPSDQARRRCAAGDDDGTGDLTSASTELAETRGDITSVVMATRSGPRLCLLVRDRLLLFRGLSQPDGTARGAARSAVGGGLVDDVHHVALTFIAGRVLPGTTTLTADVPHLPTVVATVAAGWFVAWWPGDVAADRVVLHPEPRAAPVPAPIEHAARSGRQPRTLRPCC